MLGSLRISAIQQTVSSIEELHVELLVNYQLYFGELGVRQLFIYPWTDGHGVHADEAPSITV